jgi:hypothetical protein
VGKQKSPSLWPDRHRSQRNLCPGRRNGNPLRAFISESHVAVQMRSGSFRRPEREVDALASSPEGEGCFLYRF